jgi:hypothetical protein
LKELPLKNFLYAFGHRAVFEHAHFKEVFLSHSFFVWHGHCASTGERNRPTKIRAKERKEHEQQKNISNSDHYWWNRRAGTGTILVTGRSGRNTSV